MTGKILFLGGRPWRAGLDWTAPGPALSVSGIRREAALRGADLVVLRGPRGSRQTGCAEAGGGRAPSLAAALCRALSGEKGVLLSLRLKDAGGASFWWVLGILGGEPFEPENQPGLLELSRRIKAAYPEKSIWSFTGYLFDRDILAKKLGPWEVTQELLSYLDVLVDGPFVASLKNLNLRFRGSSNQRLIDVPASLKTGAVVLWDERQ